MTDEASLLWRKSSHSGTTTSNCVEPASAGRRVAVRDSKHPENGHFTVTRTMFRSLAETVKANRL